jgi:hypothetical protein
MESLENTVNMLVQKIQEPLKSNVRMKKLSLDKSVIAFDLKQRNNMMILDESIQNESSFESLNLREATPTPSVKRVNFAESDGELSFQQ